MKILIVILLVGALGAGGWFYTQRQRAGAVPQVSTKVDTAVIETRNIKFAINAAGDITPAEQVSVRPEVNGKIEVLPVDVGDRVKSGQLLFKLDDRELQTQRQQEDKNVERSRLQLGQAERDYKRAQLLFEGKLISQELFEDSRTKFDLAKNELALREKSLELIVERLRKTEVMAPFDSTILTRPISVGQAVSGSGGFNAGTEVLTIANLNDLIVNAHINQADVTRLHVDQQVEVSVEAVSGLKVVGKVERIAPQSTLKNNIRGFAARILLKDVDSQIRPGMSANISIPVASADNVVSTPLAAVFTETNPATREIERHIWVRKDETWERRPIKIGVSDYFFAEVTSGLQAGEVVSLEDRAKEMGMGSATNSVKVATKATAAQR
ncbi:MAG: efflux RND transporter periplasmic adaptor subunit [Verrucomicrobia bacterium]|nr:efflux RND transporter periplasmic adaptor subunit [Verrucomicrobiota bacterium]